ncbi:2-keto-4-pentenoate hydratase [Variovorax sp.]|uniref:2-keto-4-pentenoate hydratase n=1 Tax=Variovorax sp. TaxID=1871043 RepID=UPI002D504AC7|nr:fumarylacetoacetate hydrolase family protein [Variovorax sp.]HYP83392.1 fumarylacetoacetate hydrolase family protein [Variovorax sp.]
MTSTPSAHPAPTPEDLLRHLDSGALWPAERNDAAWPDLPTAYQAALAVRELRIARGERPVGYKIGFTNRTIWERYAVFAPIWGTVWDSTVSHADASGNGTLDLKALAQPRLEPEVVFGLRATPPRSATLEQVFDCVDWLAAGFEVVQSHCADWKFSAAETVADSGLHGRLLVGPPTPVRDLAATGEALDELLAGLGLRLWNGTRQVDEGVGRNVLDGPLHALLHFVQEIGQLPGAPELAAGDIVTTGTWTDAWPVQPGQQWRSEFDAPLQGLQVTFS